MIRAPGSHVDGASNGGQRIWRLVVTCLPFLLPILPIAGFAAGAFAECDAIPGTINQFRGAVGTLDRPFATPNDFVSVKVRPQVCDTTSAGLVDTNLDGHVDENDVVVMVLFQPPSGGAPSAHFTGSQCLWLATPTCSGGTRARSPCTNNSDCLPGGACDGTSAVDLCRSQLGPASQVFCSLSYQPGDLVVTQGEGEFEVRFRFPDTDPLVGDVDDRRTLAGPARVVVLPQNAPIQCDLVHAPCSPGPYIMACVDELFEIDGTCEATPDHRNATFGSFTALPPANDYQNACTTPDSPCTGLTEELRFTTDHEGNVLLPMDYGGVLVDFEGVHVPRILRGSTHLPAFSGAGAGSVRIPSSGFLSSYSMQGHRLPPLFTPLADPTASTEAALFGSVDADLGVIRIARRSPDFRQCLGGPSDGRPCLVDSPTDCPSGICGLATCRGGSRSGQSCTGDAGCPASECGPSLFDFRDRYASQVGPVVLQRADYKLEAQSPVPLDGLIATKQLFAFVRSEGVEGRRLNYDLDRTDSVVALAHAVTGLAARTSQTPVPPAVETVGRAVARVLQPPFSFPAVAVEGDVVAFLEPEPLECSALEGTACDRTFDGDVFDSLLRAYRVSPGGTAASVAALPFAVDPAPVLNGRSLVISDGLIFARISEEGTARQKTVLVSKSSAGVAAGPPGVPPIELDLIYLPSVAISSDARFVAFSSSADELVSGDIDGTLDVFVHDRDSDRDGIYDEPGAISTTSMSAHPMDALGPFPWNTAPTAMSQDGRFVGIYGVLGIYVRDRDPDRDGLFDEPEATSLARIDVLPNGLPARANAAGLWPISIDTSGRHVAFDAYTLDIPPVTSDEFSQVFVTDRDPDRDGVLDEPGEVATHLVSRSSEGQPGNGNSRSPKLTEDGRYLLFESEAENLAGPGPPTTPRPQVYLYDRDLDADGIFDEPGATLLQEASSRDPFSDETERAQFASIDKSGRFLSFMALDGRLAPGDTNGQTDVFIRDRDSDTDTVLDEPDLITFTRITSRPDALQLGVRSSGWSMLAGRGRFAAFDAAIAGVNKGIGVFLQDTITGLTLRSGVTAANAWPASSGQDFRPALSEAPVSSAFLSTRADLTPDDRNGAVADVFVRGPDQADSWADLTRDGDALDVALFAFETRVPSAFPLGVGLAEQVSIASGHAVLLVPESGDGAGASLNGDSDVDDSVVHLWRNRQSGLAANLGLAASRVETSPEWIAALVSEHDEQGVDRNGDGDARDDVVAVNALASATAGTWVSIGRSARAIQVVGARVAFATREADEAGQSRSGDLNGDGDANDQVLHVYDAATNTLRNLGLAATDFVLGDHLLAFRTREADQGIGSLNGDADTEDAILQVLDLESGRLFSTGYAALPCDYEACDPRLPYRVSEGTVTFLTYEPHQDKDLNGDGLVRDLLVHVFNVRRAMQLESGLAGGRAAGVPSEAGVSVGSVSAGLCTTTGLACASDSDCPGGTCFVPPGGCIHDLGTVCSLGDAGACGTGRFCDPAPGLGRHGTCKERVGACRSTAECTAPDVCRDEAQDIQRLAAPISNLGMSTQTGQQVFASSGLCLETGGACTIGGDCASGSRCAAGTCRRQHGTCRDNADCPAGSCIKDLITIAVADGDADELPDTIDNCPLDPNPSQTDIDGDGVGDACDLAVGADRDRDGVRDETDNCLAVANADQADQDHDGVGDACECGDANFDGFVNTIDARRIQRCVIGELDPSSCQPLCDTNADGVCNTIDARRIQRLVVGQLQKSDLRCAAKPQEVASLVPGNSPVSTPAPPACGLGFEAALVLLPLLRQRRRRLARASARRNHELDPPCRLAVARFPESQQFVPSGLTTHSRTNSPYRLFMRKMCKTGRLT